MLEIIRYGRRRVQDSSPVGDFDLFVFVDESPDKVESLHFHVGEIPVDMNIRMLSDLRGEAPLTEYDYLILDSEVLFDIDGVLGDTITKARERWPERTPRLTDSVANFDRFSHQHLLDKTKYRLDTEPLLCNILLHSNIGRLLQTYFRVRGEPWQGERSALEWLEVQAPEIVEEINLFYDAPTLTQKYAITERLTELVLAPVGGPWREGKLLALALHEDASSLANEGSTIF